MDHVVLQNLLGALDFKRHDSSDLVAHFDPADIGHLRDGVICISSRVELDCVVQDHHILVP